MITVNNQVELKATISAVGGNNFDLSITELFVDGKWEKLSAPKALNVLLADYDSTAPSASEMALVKQLITKYGSALTGDDLVAANSLKAKLGIRSVVTMGNCGQ